MGDRKIVQQKGFTLVEILVVIAIIALLAAITFPVFSRVKESANKSNDLSSMNQLRSALQLYREDQGAYPPALLGYVTLYSSGPSAGNVVPATSLKGFLYPKRVTSISTFQPNHNNVSSVDVLNDLTLPTANQKPVVFPNQDPSPVGTAPILDLDGTSGITNTDDYAGARQAFGPADGAVCWNRSLNAIVAGTACTSTDAEPRKFYAISGYDVSGVPSTTSGTQYELRYTRFWTRNAIGSGSVCGSGSDPCGMGSSKDDPRQLGYNDPPEDTVVTWNSYFRDYQSQGVPKPEKLDVILTLGGAARPADSKALFDNSWRQRRSH